MTSPDIKSRIFEWLRESLLLLFGLVLFLGAEPLTVWLLPSSKPPAHTLEWLVEHFRVGIEHLGAILIAAWIVRIAIEKAAQRQFVNLVNDEVRRQIEATIKSVSDTSLKPLERTIDSLNEELGFRIRKPGLLDDQSLKILQEKVLDPAFIVTDFCVQFTISPFKEENYQGRTDALVVNFFSMSEIRNVTTSKQPYKIRSWMDKPLDSISTDCEFTQHAYGPLEAREDFSMRKFDLREMEKVGQIRNDQNSVLLEHEIYDGIPAGAAYFTDVRGRKVMHHLDHFTWTVSRLGARLRIVVKFDGGYRRSDFFIRAIPLHHVSRDTFEATMRDSGDEISWEINQVVLPYQGIKLEWKKTTAASQQAG